MSKKEIKEMIEEQNVAEINSIISDACSDILEVASEKLGIELDGDLESSITEIVYGELKSNI